MTKTLILSVTIGLVMAAASCGDETSDAPTTGPGSGGSTTSSGGQGGSGGSAGGENTCIACAQDSCTDELAACSEVPACQAWLMCAQACDGPDGAACFAACNQTHDGSALLYEPIYECACTSCSDACDGYDTCNQKCVDDLALPLLETPPMYLSETGYNDTDPTTPADQPAPYLQVFAPTYVLWSDGAVKTRWWYVPKCTQINTSDMDHWELPVGTRFWKEFRRDGVLVETRFIHRFGPGSDDWLFAAYQWAVDLGSGMNAEDAVHVPAGVQNANNTPHDIPSEGDCVNCHGKLVERALGFSAIQLTPNGSSNMSPTTMATLSNTGRLTVPSPDGFPAPGSEAEQRALGYLHANCGNCHNATGVPFGMKLRLLTGFETVQATDTWTTAVGVPVMGPFASNPLCNGCSRIAPGNAESSAIIIRMSTRGAGNQMPPLGTEIVDPPGIDAVSAWINSISDAQTP
jgi:hypothetical protein